MTNSGRRNRPGSKGSRSVPAFVVASWSDHSLHSRGTLEGFRRISSRKKWLLVHGRKKWAHYYDPENVEQQRAFFDHFLKGTAPEPDWPAVRYELRDRAGSQTQHSSAAWPLPEVEYRRFHLDPAASALVETPSPDSSHTSYDSLAEDGEAAFDLRFDGDIAIAGHAWLHLHLSLDDADDADLFIVLEKLDSAGAIVPFMHYAIFEDGPVALGWLRLSHRELDPRRTTDFLPVLQHRRALKVRPAETVEADIEILPSGTRFSAGETLRLRIRGRDGRSYPRPLLYARHEDTVNRGMHRIWGGGNTDSWLQLPIVPV